MGRVVVVSEAVRRNAAAEGPVCQRWLADLGELITHLERDWAMKVGLTLHGGSTAFDAEAVTADGTPAGRSSSRAKDSSPPPDDA